MAESGYKDFSAVDWKVVVAPAGTPAEIVKRLNAAIEKALTQPALIAQLAAEGSTPMAGSPESVAKYVRAEQLEWRQLIRDANIKPD